MLSEDGLPQRHVVPLDGVVTGGRADLSLLYQQRTLLSKGPKWPSFPQGQGRAFWSSQMHPGLSLLSKPSGLQLGLLAIFSKL